MEHTYKNRDNIDIIFDLNEAEKTCTIDSSKASYIRIGEPELTELDKKNNPDRVKNISWVDFPGGPFVFVEGDLNDFLCGPTKGLRDPKLKPFLEARTRKIIKKIEVNPGIILLHYEEKSIKKAESEESKKDTSKKS